jgi:hypothetical protein
MAHMTRIERCGLERGRAEGQAKRLLRALERRWRWSQFSRFIGGSLLTAFRACNRH